MRVRRLISLLVLLWASQFVSVQRIAAQTNSSSKKVDAPAQGAPAVQPPEKSGDDAPQVPAQLTLLETSYRFEADGSSRKEVHTVVKINSELGVRQFAHLNFDYNRAFETVEIPLVRVTHSSGGTADVLPAAITDAPNPAVTNASAYQDVRVKSVRILGLEPSDTLEYRVITNVLPRHPLEPDFWLAHSFDRSGVVGKEIFTIDLPSARHVQVQIDPAVPATSGEPDSAAHAGREIYSWSRDAKANARLKPPADGDAPDITFTTFASWEALSARLAKLLSPVRKDFGEITISAEVEKKTDEITLDAKDAKGKLVAIYNFVSQKIATVDLPLGATEFQTRGDADILSAGYGTAEDKFKLFAAMASRVSLSAFPYLTGDPAYADKRPAYPTMFTKLFVVVPKEAGNRNEGNYWLDPATEVAPFGMISSTYRGKPALALLTAKERRPAEYWAEVPRELPFAATQKVSVDAALDGAGKLTAKVKYVMRGDNELLLRIAFHESPREKWKSLAQLLSLSDGFRGQIDEVSASNPLETETPFTVEYTISQAKFIDWSKKSLRLPALLPNVALPDAPPAGAALIDLGTPLDVETSAVLRLPAGALARQAPTGTSVSRDYASFSSKYSMLVGGAEHPAEIVASRHVSFLLRTIPAERSADYGAFVRAVQNDQAQGFVVDAAVVAAGAGKP
ncbi:MAG TPA: DUF3857 domain-containing protein [Candidatus Dormibacteraeota bacterium]|nr:DUF3857 domain-containing protein [Candidatus Dormibacteraeota bacterium]